MSRNLSRAVPAQQRSMRRVAVVLAAITSAVSAFMPASAANAASPGGSCGGGGGGGAGGGVISAGRHYTCTFRDQTPRAGLCAYEYYVAVALEQYRKPELINGITYMWYEQTCPITDPTDPRQMPTTRYPNSWVVAVLLLPIPQPGQLAPVARTLLDSTVLPKPLPKFAPPIDDHTFVNIPTSVWQDPVEYGMVSVTVNMPTPGGVVSTTARAIAQSVTFNPGDGTSATCPLATTAGQCTHTYTWPSVRGGARNARGFAAYPATVTVTWATSWANTADPNGPGPWTPMADIVRTTVVPVAVGEWQTVLTGLR